MKLRQLLLVLALVLPLLITSQSFSAPADQCGVWRWGVKTLSDTDATQVDFVPKARTIRQLHRLRPPDTLGKNTTRIAPHEFRVYRIRARLLQYKREKDRDYHVVVAQVNRPSRTMVVEVVDPTCPGAMDSDRVDAVRALREKFIGLYGEGPSSGFREVPGRPVAFITGVGFWDLCTGAHKPHGAAPNCIELHPVLEIEPAP